MQEINTNQNLILLAQFTSSKNGNGTFEEEKSNQIKEERSSKRQPFLQKRFVFFSVIMYCTIQYIMLPYTYKNQTFFHFCKGKNRTILSHGFLGKQVLYPPFAISASYCIYQCSLHRKDVSPSHQMSLET